jgi:hypothetical protein
MPGGQERARAAHAPRQRHTRRALPGQRWAMYIVISMPKRRSIARGVSHFMTSPPVIYRTSRAGWPGVPILAKTAGRAEADHHESPLMIFMSRDSRGAATM